jgi:hypothetical protein
MDIKGQLEKDALEFSTEFCPRRNRAQAVEDYQIAYMAGAKQLKIYVNDFVERVDTMLGEPKGEFELGQRDALFWLLDHVTDLFTETEKE